MSEENNNKQNIDIAQIQKDVEYIKVDLAEIKTNHLKHIYDKIDIIEATLNARPTWTITMLVSVCLALFTFFIAHFLVH